MSLCPNCGRDEEVHNLFSPARCPVIRLRFPETDIVPYSNVTPNGTSDGVDPSDPGTVGSKPETEQK